MYREPRGIADRRGDVHRRNISPTGVVKLLRDAGPMTLSELYEGLGLGVPNERSSRDYPTIQRFRGIMEQLRRAELAVPLVADDAHWEAPYSLSPDEGQAVRWQTTPRLIAVQAALELSLGDVAESRVHEEEVARIRSFSVDVDRRLAAHGYGPDFAASLWEMGACLGSRSYIATIALSGKILEMALKHRLTELGVPHDASWMLGKLIPTLKESGEYLDPALGNIANIIKESRNPAVHATTGVPIPSADQAVMVVNAVLDTVRRLVLDAPVSKPKVREWKAYVHVSAADGALGIGLVAVPPSGGKPTRARRLAGADPAEGFALAMYWIDNAFDARDAAVCLYVSDPSLEEAFGRVRPPTPAQASFLASLEGRAPVRVVHVTPEASPEATEAARLAEAALRLPA